MGGRELGDVYNFTGVGTVFLEYRTCTGLLQDLYRICIVIVKVFHKILTGFLKY